MRVARGELWTGRALLLALMAFTLLPFISIFVTALHPSGTVPGGLEWPADPQWGNFVVAFNVADMPVLHVEHVHCPRRRARVPYHLDDGRVRHRPPPYPWRARAPLPVRVRADAPVPGDHHPDLLLARAMGILNTRLAIVLPLIGLYMPFAVFWMRAHFVNMPGEISEAARVDGASTSDLLAHPRAACAGPDRVARGPPCPSGRGTSSCWRGLVEDPTQRTMAGALGAFQGHCRRTSRCCAPARC